MHRSVAALVVLVAFPSLALASQPGQPLDCDDWVILDPGIGFGKRVEDNLAILAHFGVFAGLGFPLLAGISRKSFLGAVTGRSVEERLAGTVAANAIAALQGASILRVHDVKEAVDVARLVEAVRSIAHSKT